MICHSSFNSARDLMRQLRSDPLQVYLDASIRGRPLLLTLEGMLEFDPELVVLGPGRSWRVHVRREFGKLMAVPVRIRNSGLIIAKSRSAATGKRGANQVLMND